MGWVQQQDGTYIRKQSSWSSSSSSGGAGYKDSAQGPGDYNGTMSKAELEREAGGNVFSGSRNQETRHQVSNTEYKGGSGSSAGESYDAEVSGNDVVVTKGGKWDWSDVNNKWEWEDDTGASASAKSYSNVQTESDSDDSGLVQLSNGTWTKRQSSGTKI